MNSLPIESPCWRVDLRQRIGLETAILRSLIQWGMAESSSDVCRGLEEYFDNVREDRLHSSAWQSAQRRANARPFVRDLLTRAYLRTRVIPRRGALQERLHNGLLTGFEELALEILHAYDAFCFVPERDARSERAA